MHVAAKSKILPDQLAQGNPDLSRYVPEELAKLDDPQTAIPRIAKDAQLIRLIERAVHHVPTSHTIYRGDARDMSGLEPHVHLVLTSPPYWTLKEYRDSEGQLGHVEDYDQFLQELDKVWKQCFQALVPGGRLICVVGDVCLSRRENGGRHTVVPLHSSIQEHCRKLGYDNLAPIIWHKISNAAYEVEGGSTFLGKPYEPNSVIKNDIEFILMERKPGGYRTPDISTKVLSVISAENHKKWFQQIWSGTRPADRRASLPLFRTVAVNGPDDPKWTQLGWPDNPALTASKADMEEGTLVIYYSTAFPKFAGQRHAFENRDSTLATSFAKRYEIWLAVHSLLYYQDHQGAGAEQQAPEGGADGPQRVQEDPDLAQERERQERCRIAILSSLFAAREVQMETPHSFAVME